MHTLRLIGGVAAALTLACGTPYEAAVRLTIEGSEGLGLQEGGGYQVDLDHADGRVLDGVKRRFVAYEPGKQEVVLVVQDEDTLGAASKLRVRIRVRAVASPQALAHAAASVVTTLQRGEVVNAKVVLEPDPRPVLGSVSAFVNSAFSLLDGRNLAVSWKNLVLPANRALHVGLQHDVQGYIWLGRLDPAAANGEASFTTNQDVPLYQDPQAHVVVHLLPSDELGPLSTPAGWLVFRGELPNALRGDLTPLLGNGGEIAKIALAFDIAREHATLARDSLGSASDVRMHSEHVFVALNGNTTTPLAGDLDGDGVETNLTGDPLGLVGRLTNSRTAAIAIAERSYDDGVSRAALGAATSVCGTSTLTAISAAKAAAQACAADPGTAQRGLDLVAAVDEVWGDPEATVGGTHTLECFIVNVELLSVFALPSLGRDAD